MAVVKLADICQKIGSGATPRGGKEAYRAEGIALVRSQNVLDFSFSSDGLAYINDEQADKLRNVELQSGDVLLNITGDSVARACLMDDDYLPGRVNQHVAIIRVDESKAVNSYLLYYLQWRKSHLLQLASAGATRNALTKGMIEQLEIDLPSLDEQRKVVGILDSIQNKIKLNHEINDNLSDLLQTIYQGQFGKVGLANNCGILADICSYSKDKIEISKLSLDTYYSTENMLPEKSGAVKATSLPTISQTTACHKGDTLISNIRPYFKKIVYCEDDCGCSTDVLCFKPVHPRYTAYLFSTLYADSFFDFMVAGAKGTKMPRGDKQQIMTYPVVLPSEKDLSEFNSVATPILTRIYSNRTESERLSAIRDTLLPKLILGEIDVSSIQL